MEKVMEELERTMIHGANAITAVADKLVEFAATPFNAKDPYLASRSVAREEIATMAKASREMATALDALGRLHTSLYCEIHNDTDE